MKLGIALSGGGTRGFAHLGMLQALEEVDIRPQVLSGTSAGALGAALYASGYPPAEILDIYTKSKPLKYLRPAVNFRGLIKIEKARAFLSRYLPEDSFEALRLPLSVSATNLNRGETERFSTGKLIDPILASSSLPIIFDPIQIGEERYVDGGILENLPVQPLVGTCDIILGMHCNPVGVDYQRFTFKSVMERSLMMAINVNTLGVMDLCQLFWEPPGLVGYKVFDIQRTREIYDIGYQYGKERILAGDIEKLFSEVDS